MKLSIVLILLLILSVSCAKKNKSGDDAKAVTEDSSESDDFIVDDDEQVDEDKTDGDSEDAMVDSESEDEKSSEDTVNESESMSASSEASDNGDGEEIAINETPAASSATNSSGIELSSSIGSHTVKQGETLMIIAFNIYGDYSKWKDISEQNGGIVRIGVGQTLKYRTPTEKFVWNPEGLPYLIKKNDTLGTISNDKYGTPSKWRSIYDNNRPLIKDPNMIFAGFTIYYKEMGNVANN